MSRHIIKTDRLLHENRLFHCGGPMLRFNVENGRLAERGRGVALVKPGEIKSSRLKIDGLVCLVMAIAACEERPAFDAHALIG